MSQPEKTWLTDQFFEYETDSVADTRLNLTFSNKLLIDWWFSISKSVNRFSDHGFECVLGSVISIDKSECVAKFLFASVSILKFLWA